MSSADVEAPEEADEVAPDERRDAVVASFAAALGDGLVESFVKPGIDVWLRIAPDSWVAAGEVARNSLGYRYFDFLSVIDWLPSPFGRDMDAEQDWAVHGRDERDPTPIERGYAGGETRLQVFARVYSLYEHMGVTLKVDLADDDPSIDSWVPVYAGANWHEREAWEMFGVSFEGHPGLRHLYLPGDFEGHPLRKDFPLLARRVKPWPGIVDVEGMPGEAAAEEDDS